MTSSSNEVVASDPQRGLDLKDMPVLRRLGRGLSGFIYETTWSGNRYTRKDFPLGSVGNYAFEKEAKPLFDLDHPNIVKCFGYSVGKSCCSLLQEYVDDDLQNVIQRKIEDRRRDNSTDTLHSRVLDVDELRCLLPSKVKGEGISKVDEGTSTIPGACGSNGLPLGYIDACQKISQIATGMKYLHDNRIVHGDLKPKNVLLSLEGSEWKVKLADFGLVETKKRIKLASKRSRHLEILMWKAPERLEELLGPLTEDSDDPFTDSDTDRDEDDEIERSDDFLKSRLAMADVYSFGLICAHILTEKLLFPLGLRLTQLRKQRSDGFRPALPSDWPLSMKNLICSCIQTEPLTRPTFSHICSRILLLQILPDLILKGIIKGTIPGLYCFILSCRM